MARGWVVASMFVSVALGLFSGCSEDPADRGLSIHPATADATAGSSSITFTLSGSIDPGAVRWQVDGPGTISQIDTYRAAYAPPPDVPNIRTATVAAVVISGARASSIVTIRPRSVPDPNAGDLRVDVSVPAGSALVPNIAVNGPGGFSRTVGSTQTLTSISAGTYSITANPETVSEPIVSKVYTATPAARSVSVAAGGSSSVQVAYTLRNGSGRLWVADSYGMQLRAFGATQLASSGAFAAEIILATGSSSFPTSAAMGPNGDLWLAMGSYTLARFSSGSLGGGSRVPDVTLGSGASGGFLEFISGLAFDGSGSLWLASNPPGGGEGNRRLLKFSGGRLNASASNPTPDITISAASRWYPTSLAFDPPGNLWVADAQNNQLLRYSREQLARDGTPIPTVTLRNVSAGVPLSFPVELVFDGVGNLWVGNLGDLSQPGSLVMYTATQLSAGGALAAAVTLGRSETRWPRGLALDASGGLWFGFNQGMGRYAPSQLTISGSPSPQTLVQDVGLNVPMALVFDAPAPGTPLYR